MKVIALIVLWTSCQCCVGGLGTNGIPDGSWDKTTKLTPLLVQLPAPSLGVNGAFSLPEGPHIEPVRSKLRAPFLAPVGVTNVALGKRVTASVATPVRGKFSMITDGSKEAFDFDLVEITNGVQWVQVDLEQECSIYAIVVWHNHYRLALFRGVVVQVADDASFTTNVRTLFNNDYENLAGFGSGTDKQYFEDYPGKLIDTKGTRARYLRCYSDGSSNSPLNGYAEIEAWGLSAADK
jgi:hypothetical protein